MKSRHLPRFRLHARPAPAVLACAVLAAALAASCASPPEQEPPAGQVEDSGSGDGITFGGEDGKVVSKDVATAVDGGGGGGGELWLTMSLDDTANKTFGSEEIKWTGSFSWDEKTNTIVYADSWLPADGPYPFLWDDGPISAGGHEREGAVKDDHIFTTAVKFVPLEDTTFHYGLLNEFDNWMWVGPNGEIKITKGQSGVVNAQGMTLPKHGLIDMKVSLDIGKLHEKFNTWTADSYKFFIKGTMNMWTPRQLLDDGQKGDEKAGDGIYTYQHSLNLGMHDGLLNPGDEVQFVWVATTGDTKPEAGKEYKTGAKANAEGVTAWTNTGAEATWVEVPVVLALDSKGKVQNTAIVVPGSGAEKCLPICIAPKTCVGGKCVDPDPCGGSCKDTESCEEGKCVPKTTLPCDGKCTETQSCVEGKCVEKDPCAGACKDTETCEAGKCVPKSTDPCGGTCTGDQTCVDAKCVDPLALDKVEPVQGPLVGGTKVDVTGKGFKAAAAVSFGGKTATCTFKNDKLIACETPAGDKAGKVAVVVDNGGGDKVEKADLFTYLPAPEPQVLLLAPVTFGVEEGEAVKGLMGQVRIAGVSDAAGATPDLKVEFGYGKAGSNPKVDKDWKWVAGTYKGEDSLGKGEEQYTADLGALALGSHAFAVRATWSSMVVYGDSDGSENGLDVAKLGAITVTTVDTTPKVTGINPVWMSAMGNETITVLGKNLKKDFKVEVKSSVFPLAATTTQVTEVAGGLSVLVPKGPGAMPTWPPMPASVIVTPTGAPAITLDNALSVVPLHTPTIDGKVTLEEWTTATQLGLNQETSGWGAGNTATMLFAAWDAKNLYFGVEGSCEVNNAIVVYIDLDYGAANNVGTQHPKDLKDNDTKDNSVDSAISSVLEMTDSKFKADVAFATLGMKSFFAKNLADSKEAGWRGLSNPADFAWLLGEVVAQDKAGVEASIPIATLFPKGVPAQGVTVAFFAAVINKDGSQVAPGGIAPNMSGADLGAKATQVSTFQIFPPK